MGIHRKGCSCEYCCFVQDEMDDKRAEQDYDLAVYKGRPIFDTMKEGDRVVWYNIPHEHRNVVYRDRIEDVLEVATAEIKGTIIRKHDTDPIAFLEVKTESGHIQKIGLAECHAWALNLSNENQA